MSLEDRDSLLNMDIGDELEGGNAPLRPPRPPSPELQERDKNARPQPPPRQQPQPPNTQRP